MSGVTMSAMNAATTAPNAAPMTMPTARSTTLPRSRNCLKSRTAAFFDGAARAPGFDRPCPFEGTTQPQGAWHPEEKGGSGGLDRDQLPPQLLDLVAQLRRVLEAQLLGRREHLLLEGDDEALQLRAVHALHLAAPAAALPGHRGRLERQELRDVGDALDDRLRHDPVLLVVGELDPPAPLRLLERLLDRLGHLVGVEQHLPVHVARRAPDRLDQRRAPAQEALLVGVQDRHERDLRQVEALPQQVDADQYVVLAQAQLPDDLDALQRVDLRV